MEVIDAALQGLWVLWVTGLILVGFWVAKIVILVAWFLGRRRR